MWLMTSAAEYACAAAGALAFVCELGVGALMGALYYIGWHQYVKHDSWSWSGVGPAAVAGAVSAVGSGLFGATVGKKTRTSLSEAGDIC
jgi:hypothetical protein